MTTEQLSDVLGMIDDELINEVLEDDEDHRFQHQNSNYLRRGVAAVAAMVLISLAAVGIIQHNAAPPVEKSPHRIEYLSLEDAEKNLGDDLLLAELNSLSNQEPEQCWYVLDYEGNLTDRSDWQHLYVSVTYPDTFFINMELFQDHSSFAYQERHHNAFPTGKCDERVINNVRVSYREQPYLLYAEFDRNGFTYILTFDTQVDWTYTHESSQGIPHSQSNGSLELALEYLETLLKGGDPS